MAITYASKTPIVVTLPKKQHLSFAPDKEAHGDNLEELILDTYENSTDNYGVTTEEKITCSTKTNQPAITGEIKNARSVPRARVVEYGGEVYPSLTKCLKALGLCRDRFKYLKRTRKELRSDKAIIGIMIHERRADAMQGTSYVIAIKGEVCFEQNLTAACTRVNQMLQLPPNKAMTQGQVSKYRYEHNKRPKNRDRQITLYEAFTSCLARVLVREQLLEDTDKALFKARMSVVAESTGTQTDDLFEVVDDDDSHIEALADLVQEYNRL